MSMKIIKLEQRSAVNQNIMSVILTCQINSEDKSCVYVYVHSKKGIGSPIPSFGGFENPSIT